MYKITPTLLAVALLAASAPLAAQSIINQTHPVASDGRIDVSNIKGRIQVRTWERSEVKLTATLGEGVEKVAVDGGGEHLSIQVVYPNSNGWGSKRTGPTDLQLMVPVRAELDLESVSANVDVSGVAPRQLSIQTVSGEVLAVGAPQRVEIETVSGNINATLNSHDVDVQSVSGGIALKGRMNGAISAQTVSANIDITVKDEQINELSTSTVSGDANVRTGLKPKGEIQMDTVSGQLLLVLPKDVSARASGESFSGTLHATGVTIEKRRGPGSDFSTRYGTGDGEISLETFSGDAELRLE